MTIVGYAAVFKANAFTEHKVHTKDFLFANHEVKKKTHASILWATTLERENNDSDKSNCSSTSRNLRYFILQLVLSSSSLITRTLHYT